MLLLQPAHDQLADVVVVVAIEARDHGHDDLLIDLVEESQNDHMMEGNANFFEVLHAAASLCDGGGGWRRSLNWIEASR